MKLREPKWHSGQKLWWLRIGKKHNKAGTAVEASFYWTGEPGDRAPANVVAEAVQKQQKWEQIKAVWPDLKRRLERVYSGPADQLPDYTEPVWIDFADLERREATIAVIDQKLDTILTTTHQTEAVATIRAADNHQAMLAQLIAAGVVPANLIPQQPTKRPTLREAIDEYLNHEKARTDLKIGRRLSVTSYNGKRFNLYAVFGISTATVKKAKVQRDVIDLNMKLTDFGRDQIKAVATFWFTLPDGVASSRTVKNYLNTLKAFIVWCDSDQSYGYPKPKDLDHLLTVSEVEDTHIPDFDAKLLKTVLAKGGDRAKLYAMFGLMLGYYPADIATIREADFFREGSNWYIKRERSKERGGRKSGRIIRTKHWIAPELVRLIQKYRVEGNQYGLLLLNKHGLPMYRETLEGTKHSAAAKAWEVCTQRAGVSYPFKWLRKHGYNAMKRITESNEMAARWAGHSNGIGKHYDDSVYLPVIKAQKKHAAELREAGIVGR